MSPATWSVTGGRSGIRDREGASVSQMPRASRPRPMKKAYRIKASSLSMVTLSHVLDLDLDEDEDERIHVAHVMLHTRLAEV